MDSRIYYLWIVIYSHNMYSTICGKAKILFSLTMQKRKTQWISIELFIPNIAAAISQRSIPSGNAD